MSSVPNESHHCHACKTDNLVQRLVHGDQQAFLALYVCYAAQVHALTDSGDELLLPIGALAGSRDEPRRAGITAATDNASMGSRL